MGKGSGEYEVENLRRGSRVRKGRSRECFMATERDRGRCLLYSEDSLIPLRRCLIQSFPPIFTMILAPSTIRMRRVRSRCIFFSCWCDDDEVHILTRMKDEEIFWQVINRSRSEVGMNWRWRRWEERGAERKGCNPSLGCSFQSK